MSSPEKLAGKFAVVTGAAQGIGEAIAKPLAREGAAVALADLNLPEAQRVEAEIRKDSGTSWALPVDVTQSGPVVKMVGQVLDRWGAIDILVNNAGGL